MRTHARHEPVLAIFLLFFGVFSLVFLGLLRGTRRFYCGPVAAQRPCLASFSACSFRSYHHHELLHLMFILC